MRILLLVVTVLGKQRRSCSLNGTQFAIPDRNINGFCDYYTNKIIVPNIYRKILVNLTNGKSLDATELNFNSVQGHCLEVSTCVNRHPCELRKSRAIRLYEDDIKEQLLQIPFKTKMSITIKFNPSRCIINGSVAREFNNAHLSFYNQFKKGQQSLIKLERDCVTKRQTLLYGSHRRLYQTS